MASRLTNDQMTYLRLALASFFMQVMGKNEDEIAKLLSASSVPMPVWVGRWINRTPEYRETKTLTKQLILDGLFAWITYKSGANSNDQKPNQGEDPQ